MPEETPGAVAARLHADPKRMTRLAAEERFGARAMGRDGASREMGQHHQHRLDRQRILAAERAAHRRRRQPRDPRRIDPDDRRERALVAVREMAADVNGVGSVRGDGDETAFRLHRDVKLPSGLVSVGDAHRAARQRAIDVAAPMMPLVAEVTAGVDRDRRRIESTRDVGNDGQRLEDHADERQARAAISCVSAASATTASPTMRTRSAQSTG